MPTPITGQDVWHFVVGNSTYGDSLEQNLSDFTFEKLCIYVC